MARYIDADALKDRMLNYYDCVNEVTSKCNYRGDTLMDYEVADMIEDCIDNAPTADVAPKSEVAREIIDDIEMYVLGIKSGKEIIEKTTPKIYRLKRKDYMEAVLEHLAIIKKKYTEGNKSGKK